MTRELYREDDLLSHFGVYLERNGFFILALSGNQQGRYWFQMENYRKAPDIIAVRNEVVLVGEAKVKSRELFKAVHGRKSDYQSLQYLLNTENAKQQLSDMVIKNVAQFSKLKVTSPKLRAIVVGGYSFVTLQDYMTDNRISYYVVDKETGEVSGPELFG